jgi:SAM-dependent methyltransferase
MGFLELKECLCCGSTKLYKYLDLGHQPLANSFRPALNAEVQYPLGLNVCKDCWHSQLTVVVDRDLLFKNYVYLSGTSKSHMDYFEKLSRDIYVETLSSENLDILDIGCNDGAFLRCFKRFGWNLYGVDPAQNIESDGVHRLKGYFPDLKIDAQFDVITALNVFAHNADPLGFLVGCKAILKDYGFIKIQTSQRNMLINGEFDTVYHEHQSYFTINSMAKLCARAGLWLEDVEIVNMHGESYLFKIRKQKRKIHYNDLFWEEHAQGKYEMPIYTTFQERVDAIQMQIFSVIHPGKPLVGYGASAKGVVLLNNFNIRPEYVVDDNPLKQNTFVPGVGSLVVPSEALMQDPRDLVIMVLAWNMYDEIKAKILANRPTNKDIIFRVFPQVHSEETK